jgi:uncharacterized repeat protein (TIGR03803 family)
MLLRFCAFGVFLSAALVIPRAAAPATWTEKVLHVFGGGQAGYPDGEKPWGKLIVDAHGNLYGVTHAGAGGAPNIAPECRATSVTGGCGSVFELSPPASGSTYWPERLLHAFVGGGDAEFPVGGLVAGPDGTLYGAADGASTSHSCSFGCAYAVIPATVGGSPESLIYRWSGASGKEVNGDLIVDATGALFGTTAYGGKYGGPYGAGTVFKLTPPTSSAAAWTKQVLYNFTGGPDGGNPNGGLHADAHGALYGTTISGGSYTNCDFQGHYIGNYCGVAFKLTPPLSKSGHWTETVLHSFTGKLDGGNPNGGLICDSSGALYGTTQAGGKLSVFDLSGVAYKLIPPSGGSEVWQLAVLHTFGESVDGSIPLAGLIAEPGFRTLYGTTGGGGTSDLGTVYRLSSGTKGWTETVIDSLGDAAGYQPQAGLVEYGTGNLFGTTPAGGQYVGGSFPAGTVFEVTDH